MGRPAKWPFENMEIGDFFFAPLVNPDSFVTMSNRWKRRLGRTFTTRQTWARRVDDEWQLCKEDDEGALRGVGCWRIS